MLPRRIIASACALCLIVPALAGAQPIHDPPAAQPGPVVYGDTKYDLQNQQDQNAAAPQGTTVARGPYGTTTAPGPQGTTAARGPYGTTTATGPYGTTTVAARATVASDGDGTNGWRIAAASEAALLAALALGSALILRARRSTPRMGM